MENKTIYYNEAVDFLRMENCPEKVEIAISRLEYPLGLDEEMIVMYQDYLFNTAPKIAHQFIDLNRLAVFPLLVKYRVIKKANVIKLTEYAREKRKMDIMSYLMDVGNQFRTRPKQMDIAAKFTPGKSELPVASQPDYSLVKAGDIVWLGNPLMPWQVLENKSGRLLVISKYVIDCLPFEDFYKRNTFWGQSSIRKRLNREYLSNLLTEQEIGRVAPVFINREDDSLSFEIPQGETGDKFFLLSVKEAKRYFRDNRHRSAPVVKYATRSMLWTVFDKWAHWWLRTPGELDADMFYVRDGEIMSINSTVQGSYFEHFGVRPAMYIDMEQK